MKTTLAVVMVFIMPQVHVVPCNVRQRRTCRNWYQVKGGPQEQMAKEHMQLPQLFQKTLQYINIKHLLYYNAFAFFFCFLAIIVLPQLFQKNSQYITTKHLLYYNAFTFHSCHHSMQTYNYYGSHFLCRMLKHPCQDLSA